VSPTLTTFLYEAANFLVLAAVLGWLFFRPVRQAINDRREKLEAEAKQAAQDRAEAENARREIDAARDHLQEELGQLRARELETARRGADQIRADARLAAEQELELVRRQAAQMSQSQADDLAQAAAVAAAQTVGKLLEQIAGRDLQAALVESACEQLRALPPAGVAPVKVESQRPLSAGERAALEEALGSAATNADFRSVDGLVGGVRISTAKGLIDATVSGLARFARSSLVKEMNHRANHHHSQQMGDDV